MNNVKILNVFIHENDMKKLVELKHKFKLSISCIIRTTYNHTIKYIDSKQLENNLFCEIKQTMRTSIKTNLKNHLLLNSDNKKIQTALSNAVWLYCRPKEFDKLSNNKYSKFKEKLHQAFSNERDEFYNYTTYIKNKQRAERETKCHSNKKS